MKFIRNWKTFNKMYEADILDTNTIADPVATATGKATSTATLGIVLSPESKKTLETIKKDYNLPYISTETPKEEKYRPFVRLIQEILKFKGPAVDGYFGVKTKDATIKFQTDNKLLKKEGVVGEETWTALLKICGLDIKPKIYNTKIVSGSATAVVPPKVADSSDTRTDVFKDINGEKDDKFTNTAQFFKNHVNITEQSKEIIKLFYNNNNINSIKILNDIYYKIKNESLVDLLVKMIPILGGSNADSWLKVPGIKFAIDLIIHSLVNNSADAKIINFAIGDLKKRNFKYMIEELFKTRANQSESYKNQVATIYKQKYGKTLEAVLVDALTDKYSNVVKESDTKLIGMMIPGYETKIIEDLSKTPVAGATTGKLQ
jgi:peptidoglycan hydrolase-like protein with peptidoglycan-binding domain